MIKSTGKYSDNKKTGRWTEYSESGELVYEDDY